MEPYTDIEKLKIEKDVVGFYISGHPLDQFKIDLQYFCTCPVNRYEEHKNKVIKLGGIVTKFTERFTKKGHPFGLFSMEDFGGTIDMALFGEDYLKNRHFLSPGSFLYLTGRVEERYNQPGVWEFRTKVIQLLQDVRENLASDLVINLASEDLTAKMVEKIESAILLSPGKCNIKINISDAQSGIVVNLLSKKYMISVTNDLIEKLEDIEGVRIHLISKKINLPAETKPNYKKFAKA